MNFSALLMDHKLETKGWHFSINVSKCIEMTKDDYYDTKIHLNMFKTLRIDFKEILVMKRIINLKKLKWKNF